MSTTTGDDGSLVADDVDPDIRAFLRATSAAAAQLATTANSDVETRRAIAEKVRERWASGGPAMAATEELDIGSTGVRIRIHRPASAAPLSPLVYIHGGGWTLFSLDTHDRLMREYAARAGVAVVGVDYSLSPEARFPFAIGEIVETIDWLRANGPSVGIDPLAIAIGGDSAGANLALAANLMLRDANSPVCAAMLLNYGAFDMAIRPSHARFGGDSYMLTVPEMEDFWANYLRGPDDERNPLARPLLADLSDLPPAFLCIAECDILADENHEMASRLKAAGGKVTEMIYKGATHSFLEAVSISKLADRALAESSQWLRSTLDKAAAERA